MGNLKLPALQRRRANKKGNIVAPDYDIAIEDDEDIPDCELEDLFDEEEIIFEDVSTDKKSSIFDLLLPHPEFSDDHRQN